MLSRVCDEFSIDPLRALRVIENSPPGLIEDILELRAYAATWQAIRSAQGDGTAQRRIYNSPSGRQVLAIEAELAREARAARETPDEG